MPLFGGRNVLFSCDCSPKIYVIRSSDYVSLNNTAKTHLHYFTKGADKD